MLELTQEIKAKEAQFEEFEKEAKRKIDEVSEEKAIVEGNLLDLQSAQSAEQEVAALERRVKEDEHEFDRERLTLLAKSRQVASSADKPYRELYEKSQMELSKQLAKNKRIEEDHLATVMRLQQQLDSTEKRLLAAFHETLARVSEENRSLAEKGLTRDVQQKLEKYQALEKEAEQSRSAARKVLLQLHRVERMYTRVMLETSMWKEKCHLLEARIIALKRKASGKPPLDSETKAHLKDVQVKGSLAHPRMDPLRQSADERSARESLEHFAQVSSDDYKAVPTESIQSSLSPKQGTEGSSMGGTGVSNASKNNRRGHLSIETATNNFTRYPFGIAQQLATTISEARKIEYSEIDENMHVVARLLAQTSDMISDEDVGDLATSITPHSPLKRQSSARSMEQFTAFAAAHVDAAKAASKRAEQMETKLRNAPSDPALALLQSSKMAQDKDNLFPSALTHTLPSRNKTGLKGFVTVDSSRTTFLPQAMQNAVARSSVQTGDSMPGSKAGVRRTRPTSAAPRLAKPPAPSVSGTAMLASGSGSKRQRPHSAHPQHRQKGTSDSALPPKHAPGITKRSSSFNSLRPSSARPSSARPATARSSSGTFKFLLEGTAQNAATHNLLTRTTSPETRQVSANLILGSTHQRSRHK